MTANLDDSRYHEPTTVHLAPCLLQALHCSHNSRKPWAVVVICNDRSRCQVRCPRLVVAKNSFFSVKRVDVEQSDLRSTPSLANRHGKITHQCHQLRNTPAFQL